MKATVASPSNVRSILVGGTNGNNLKGIIRRTTSARPKKVMIDPTIKITSLSCNNLDCEVTVKTNIKLDMAMKAANSSKTTDESLVDLKDVFRTLGILVRNDS